MKRICSVSVDLDGIGCYYAIHGLGEPPAEHQRTILQHCVPRFVELFARRGICATFFFVARDVEATSAVVRDLAESGHEIGNHSYSHPYDLARLGRQVIDAEIRRAHTVLAQAAGAGCHPVGFRAPGYGLTADILSVLADHNYRYDSSIFPSWPYAFGKAGIMAWMRLVGRQSGAQASSLRDLVAPPVPYRPNLKHPYRRGQSPVVELPISVTRGLRLPALGTAIVASPPWLGARLVASLCNQPFVNLELHGIDLCDAVGDEIPVILIARQPDLRVPLHEKRRRLEAALDRLALDYEFVLLKDVACDVQRRGSAP